MSNLYRSGPLYKGLSLLLGASLFLAACNRSANQSSVPNTATPTSTLEAIASPTDMPTATPAGMSRYDGLAWLKVHKCDDVNRDGMCGPGEYPVGYELDINGFPLVLPPPSETEGIIRIGALEAPYFLQGGVLYIGLPEGQYVISDPLYPGWARSSPNASETRTITQEDADLERLVNPPITFVNYQTGSGPTPTGQPTRTPTGTYVIPSLTPTPQDTKTPDNTPTPTDKPPTNTPNPTNTPQPTSTNIEINPPPTHDP